MWLLCLHKGEHSSPLLKCRLHMIAAFQTELCRKWGARRINITVEMSDIYHCIWQKKSSTVTNWDFTGGPVVGNPPSNAGDAGSIPGQGTEIPHNGAGKPASCDYWAQAHIPQWKILRVITKTWNSQINKEIFFKWQIILIGCTFDRLRRNWHCTLLSFSQNPITPI